MKQFYLLSILFFGLFNTYSQTQITLTFQAKDSLTQNALALDSVHVKNVTENCDTTLYGAISVLNINALWPVGMEDPFSSSSESFVVMQNVPNPFEGTTRVNVYLKNAGELILAVYDNRGKNLSQYHKRFEKGWHLFGISTQASQVMFLKVSDDKTTKTTKIISTAPGNEGERISYIGQTDEGSILKSAPDAAGFIFCLGNQLQYTAYVEGYQVSILFDNPVSSEIYTFAMLSSVFTCGSFITLNHVAGAVAPVTKTTTYGTVTNISGATSKCWITSNLGADHQATSVNDTTEASAGWYWQFNRKQGYKHTGTIRTPNTTWTTFINENIDWEAANDPCALELDNNWRIPTLSEWTNVDASGNWTNWGGPWESALKMHAAGDVNFSSGMLYSRGADGSYWSNTKSGTTNGWNLGFGSYYSSMVYNLKSFAFSIRCIRD